MQLKTTMHQTMWGFCTNKWHTKQLFFIRCQASVSKPPSVRPSTSSGPKPSARTSIGSGKLVKKEADSDVEDSDHNEDNNWNRRLLLVRQILTVLCNFVLIQGCMIRFRPRMYGFRILGPIL